MRLPRKFKYKRHLYLQATDVKQAPEKDKATDAHWHYHSRVTTKFVIEPSQRIDFNQQLAQYG